MSSVETKNEEGELLCVNQFSTFVMGAGGFGGKCSSPHAKVQQCTCVYMHAVADLGGVRGVQLHPPLAGEVHFHAYTT